MQFEISNFANSFNTIIDLLRQAFNSQAFTRNGRYPFKRPVDCRFLIFFTSRNNEQSGVTEFGQNGK